MSVSSFFQTGWIVEDLHAAIEAWLSRGQTGPFYVNPRFTVEDFQYRGAHVPLTISTAFAQVGPIQIELIQQHSDGPSPYRDVFASGQGGFHHLCALVDDYDAQIARHRAAGDAIAGEGRLGEMRFGYVDTRSELGAMLEYANRTDAIVRRFGIVSDAAIDWDGRDPVRSFPVVSA